MAIKRIGVVFDDASRPETTGIYCLRALRQVAEVEHCRPSRLQDVRAEDFDLFINIDDGYCHPWPDELRPAAYWAIDTHMDFESRLAKARSFDLVFAAQRDGAALLAAQGIESADWLPLACDPEIHRGAKIEKRYDVCFVGNLVMGERVDLVNLLQREFPNIFVGRAYFEEMAKVYAGARIVFNRSVKNDVNMRVFEALASGSMLLTNELLDNGLGELFQDGVHLATYNCADELLDKARYYLSHEEARERVAASGQAEVLRRHTYSQRMQTVLDHLERRMPMRSPSLQHSAIPQQDSSLPDGRGINPFYFDFARPELLALVPRDARRLLDVGCGAGRLGASIKERQRAEVTGIELNEGAARLAQERIDRVVLGDIENPANDFAEGAFDCVVCGDVLEHLKRPDLALRQIHCWLAPGGRLVASIPNARNIHVLTGLLDGNWTYESAGLLDATHLRFFTRLDIEQLFYRTGFEIRQMGIVPEAEHADWLNAGRPGKVRLGKLDVVGLPVEEAEEFYVCQFLVDAHRTQLSVHDAAGRRIRTINPLGLITTSVYDTANRNIGTIDPLLNRTTYIYDQTGRQIGTLDAELNRTTSVFDAAGRQVAEVDGNGHRTTLVFDAANRRTAIVDANARRTTFGYDANGQVLTQTDPLLRVTTFSYDAAQRPAQRIDARGVRTTYAYDGANQLTGRRYSDGTRVTLAYDAVGNRTAMQDSSGRYTYSHDALSRLSRFHDRSGLRLTYTYDAVGQPRQFRSSSVRYTYTFDVAGRTRVANGGALGRFTWTYDAAGRTLAKRNNNRTRVSYTYDDADRVTRVFNYQDFPATSPSDYHNVYDKVGNRIQTTDAASGTVTTYGYDRAYQLVRVGPEGTIGWSDLTLDEWSALTLEQWSEMTLDGTAAGADLYQYDPVGNRLVFRRAAGSRVTYTYDAANQMTRILDAGVPTTLTYDQSGNPTRQRNDTQPFNVTLTWDAENRLRDYHQTGMAGGDPFNQRLTHTYNGDGQRVERDGGPGFAKYVWDRQNIHQALNSVNGVLQWYAYEPAEYGKLLRSNLNVPLFDTLGSVTAFTNATIGSLFSQYTYGAWGEITALSAFSPNVPFLFVGRLGYLTDDEGITSSSTSPQLPVYVRARFYSALDGRWISPDPIGFAAGGANLYLYVYGSPTGTTDPSGLVDDVCACCETAISDFQQRSELLIGPAKNRLGRCRVIIRCSTGCPNRLPATTREPRRGLINICIDCRLGNAAIEQALAHEFQHAIDYCDLGRGEVERRESCVRFETRACEAACGVIFDARSQTNQFNRCVECCVWFSCRGKIRVFSGICG